MYHTDNETRIKFYETFGKTEETVFQDIKTIKTWLETQNHLPEIMDDAKIRNMLHLCKFNVQKTKERIDNYYTFRTKYPNTYNGSNPKCQPLKETMETTYICNHPQLVNGVHRAMFLGPKEKNSMSVASGIKLFFCVLEVRLQEDLMTDDILIIDMANITFMDMCKLSPTMVLTSIKIYKNVFSLRVRAVYFINSPSYISAWMALFKLFTPAKIFNRYRVHKDSEGLKEIFSPDALPKDYGGKGPSLDELNDLMKQKFAEYQERFDFLDTLKDNESLRA